MALVGGPPPAHDPHMEQSARFAQAWSGIGCIAVEALACALAVVLSVPAGAADEPAAKPGSAGDAPPRRQFDFWLGDWDVRDATGKLVGRNRITRVQGGCALEEQWSGNGGVTGSSLN